MIYDYFRVRQHMTIQKQMGLLRERHVGKKKGLLLHCCNQVWMQNGGRIPWSASAICETCKIPCLRGKHFTNGDSANHLKDQYFRLVRWSNITQFLPKTCRDCISSARKSHQEYSSFMYLRRGTFWSQTLRNWKSWTHLKAMPGDSMRRKC